MASKRELVIEAVVALVRAAAPAARVVRNLAKPEEIPAGGHINIMDGDPGEPTVTLNPLEYIYDHHLTITAAAKPSGLTTADQALDALLVPIGAAIAANRTLGGLCDFLAPMAPTVLLIDGAGAPAYRQADFSIVATYGTTNPLG